MLPGASCVCVSSTDIKLVVPCLGVLGARVIGITDMHHDAQLYPFLIYICLMCASMCTKICTMAPVGSEDIF